MSKNKFKKLDDGNYDPGLPEVDPPNAAEKVAPVSPILDLYPPGTQFNRPAAEGWDLSDEERDRERREAEYEAKRDLDDAKAGPTVTPRNSPFGFIGERRDEYEAFDLTKVPREFLKLDQAKVAQAIAQRRPMPAGVRRAR